MGLHAPKNQCPTQHQVMLLAFKAIASAALDMPLPRGAVEEWQRCDKANFEDFYGKVVRTPNLASRNVTTEKRMGQGQPTARQPVPQPPRMPPTCLAT